VIFGFDRAATPSPPRGKSRPLARVVGMLMVLALGALVAFTLWPVSSPATSVNGMDTTSGSEPGKVTRILSALNNDGYRNRLLERHRGDRINSGNGAFVIPQAGSTSPLGRVVIPAINLDTPFFNGVTYDVLANGPGHWPGTPMIGEAGNAVLSGHRTTYTHPFGDLNLLHRRDAVVFEFGPHTKYTYRVFKVRLIAEERYADYVLRQPRDPRARTVTMYACAPKGYHTYRIVAQARASDLETGGRRSGARAT
jgi:LPXTG-site transpeptidase (sortase) family protein